VVRVSVSPRIRLRDGVEDHADRVVVGQSGARRAEHLADRGRDRLLVARFPVDELRHAPGELRVELRAELARRRGAARQRAEGRVLRRLLERQRSWSTAP
jgi:hypothetical protein